MKSPKLENSILDRVIKGEESALRYLVEEHQNIAFSIALRIVNNREDAEEVVQDGFVKAFKGVRAFNRKGKFSTWLYRIIYNTALTKIRGKKSLYNLFQDSYSKDAIEIHGLNDGFIKLKNDEQKKYIELAVAQLETNEQLLISLFYTSEMSIIEIAEITGINKSTIKVNIHRARKKLQIILSEMLHIKLNDLI